MSIITEQSRISVSLVYETFSENSLQQGKDLASVDCIQLFLKLVLIQ
jgi:hypothetical protein